MTDMAELPRAGSTPDHAFRAADAEAMLAALRKRGVETVDRLMRENEPHWRSLSDADRRTVESMARTIASRLVDRPAGRLSSESGTAAQDAYVRALCQLFAVEAVAGSAREPRAG
jgi:glutamyl-tRNA reductase